jgi:hypothetical protein
MGSVEIVDLFGRERLLPASHSGALRVCRWTLPRRGANESAHHCKVPLRSSSVICSRGCRPTAPVRLAKFACRPGWLRGELKLARSYRTARARSHHEFREACRLPGLDSSFRATSIVRTGTFWRSWRPALMDPGCCAVRLGLGCCCGLRRRAAPFGNRYGGGLCVAARRARWLLSGRPCRAESRL